MAATVMRTFARLSSDALQHQISISQQHDLRKVHPRACGGNGYSLEADLIIFGSSPRMLGTGLRKSVGRRELCVQQGPVRQHWH